MDKDNILPIIPPKMPKWLEDLYKPTDELLAMKKYWEQQDECKHENER